MNMTATLTCLALLGCQSQEPAGHQPAPAPSAVVAASGEPFAGLAASASASGAAPIASASALLSAYSSANPYQEAAREAALREAAEFGLIRPLGPEPPPPSVRMGTTTVNGRLPPEVVKRIVRQHVGRFRLCYEGALRANPTLEGKVTTTFTIRSDGSTEGVSTSTDLIDKNVAPCIAKVFALLSYPQPEGGVVKVSYPLLFSPGEAKPEGR